MLKACAVTSDVRVFGGRAKRTQPIYFPVAGQSVQTWSHITNWGIEVTVIWCLFVFCRFGSFQVKKLGEILTKIRNKGF